MAIFHDLGEVKYGDVPGFSKTKIDVENESAALDEIENENDELNISDLINDVREFDLKESKEARFLNALDKIEALIQHNEADIKSWIPREYDLNLIYGIEESKFDKLLNEMRFLVKTQTEEKIKAEEPRPEE